MSSTVVNPDYIEYVRPTDPDWDDEALSSQTRRVRRAFLVSLFIDRDYYVQTICDDDETVLAFSVTTRSKRSSLCYRSLNRLACLPGGNGGVHMDKRIVALST